MTPQDEVEAAANAMLKNADDDTQRQALELIPVHIRGMAALLAAATEKHGRLDDTSIDVHAPGPAVETDLYRFEIWAGEDVWRATDRIGGVWFSSTFSDAWGSAVREAWRS